MNKIDKNGIYLSFPLFFFVMRTKKKTLAPEFETNTGFFFQALSVLLCMVCMYVRICSLVLLRALYVK